MAKSVAEFWRLVEQSRLLAGQQCVQLQREFSATNGSTDHSSSHALAEWLVSRNIFSRYQATVLMAGQPGPFVYGDYKIYDRVDAGRLANEFRAVHAATGHPVLLKFLTGPIVTDPQLWSLAAAEAQVSCSVIHPNLQRFFELVDLGSFKFLVEEDLHGETLEERVGATRIPPPEACRIAQSVASALAALHASGRPHGDVRPLNTWMELSEGQQPSPVKLLRDPLLPAGQINFAANDTHGLLLAKSDYLAPELAIPGKTADVLTDIYALGCTLYQLLSGHAPFPGGSVMQKMSRHASEPIRPLESYGVPQPLAQLVTFLMAKNPALRYQDAKSVVEQLANFIDRRVTHLPTPAALPTLTAFEAAVRQSQAGLATKNMQNTFGMAAVKAVSTVDVEAPVVRPTSSGGIPKGNVPAGTVPKGTVARGTVPTGKLPAGTVPVGSIPKGTPVGAVSVGSKPSSKGQSSPIIVPIAATNDPKMATKEARERQKLIVILSSVGVAAIALIIGVNMMGRNKEPPDITEDEKQVEQANEDPELEAPIGVQTDFAKAGNKPPIHVSPDAVTIASPPKPATAVETPATFEVVTDDGKLPWASPTAGPPIDLKYVPALAGVCIVVRASDLLASEEGTRALEAAGPKVSALKSEWENAAGLKMEDCEQLIVSLHDNSGAFPKVSIVARLAEAADAKEISAKWSGASQQKEDEQTYYQGTVWSYYLPAAEEGKVLVMAPMEEIREIIKTPSPPRKRELEQIRRASDSMRHTSVLFDPTFLFSGAGDSLFEGDMSRAKAPLAWLLGEGVQAAALSLHFGESFYVELRAQTKVDKPPRELADDFRKRLATLPGDVRSYFVKQLNPPEYWKGLAFDFPAMLKTMHEYTRVGTEDKQAVVNVYLPAPAGHNLVLGTELTLATAPGSGSTTTAAATTKQSTKTVEDVLKLQMKEFSFTQTTFEDAIRDVESEAKEMLKGATEFSIVILGDDLKATGITRNKSLSNFSQQNKSVAEVLTALCMANNNVPNVKKPSELDQKLVWAVAEDSTDKKRKVFITTRDGAAAHGYKLPEVFAAK